MAKNEVDWSLKGTVQRDFRPSVFFSSFEPDWPTDQWVKIFSICDTFPLKECANVLRNGCWQYDNARRLTPAVSYCAKISPHILTISAQYHTAGILTLRSMTLQRDGPCAVSYRGQTDSAQYDTARRFIKIRISHRKRNQNRKYFNPLVSGPG